MSPSAALRDRPVAGPRTDAFAGLLAGARALAEHIDGLDGVPLAPLVDITFSMSRRGNCYDNAAMESWFSWFLAERS